MNTSIMIEQKIDTEANTIQHNGLSQQQKGEIKIDFDLTKIILSPDTMNRYEPQGLI